MLLDARDHAQAVGHGSPQTQRVERFITSCGALHSKPNRAITRVKSGVLGY
jgi:hypothetical protein